MTRSSTELQVPEAVSLHDLTARLATRYALKEESERNVTRTWLDSFDWRLHQAGVVLAYLEDAGRRELRWREQAGGALPLRLAATRAPGFPHELPEGPLRERLARLLEMRALLPLVQVHSAVIPLRVLDDEEKTVVRLELEQARYCAPAGGQEGPLPARLRLVPVKGYDGDFDRVRQALPHEFEPSVLSLREVALQAIGRTPGDYSSRLDYRLRPDERADEAAKEIHLGLLRTLEANVEGTIANLDSEFLHDLRVATRRTRSALTQIKGVFTPEVVERYKGEFAWLQAATGPTRDMDVYLLALDDYRAELPPFLQPDLEPLRGFLQAHHRSGQKAMVRELGSPRFDTLLGEWRAFLEAPVPNVAIVPNAVRPVKEVADRQIWKMYRRVLREGRAIVAESPPEELHELRKSCKKLRYLMEFFQSLYPNKEIGALIKILKVLLDNLGNFQDLEVQAHTLQGFATRMVEEGKAGAGTLLAMGALIGGLTQRQREARSHFAEIFTGFDGKGHREAFKRLFREAAA